MADKSSVKVHFLGEASHLAAAARKARGEVASVGSHVDKSGRGMMNSFKGIGAAAKAGIAGVVTGSLAAGGKAVFDMAANMQLMDAKAKTVFGSQISVVQKWAQANANAMGLTSKEAVGLSAGFADLLIPMGFTREQAAKMSTDVVGLSGALSQWSGGTKSAAEVSEILSAAMLGERDGLKSLGISISEADVQTRLAAQGKDKLKGAALEQAKAEATAALIFEKSKDAQAAYARGADTLAGKKAKLTAQVKELRDKAIAYLIPKLVELGNWVNTNVVPAIQRLVAGFRNGTGSGGKVREMVDRVRAAFHEMRPSVEKVVTVVGRLVSAFVQHALPVLVKFVTTVAPAVWKVAATIAGAFSKLVQVVLSVFSTILNGAAKAFGWMGPIGDKLKSAAQDFAAFKDSVNASLNGIQKHVEVRVQAVANLKAVGGSTAAVRNDPDFRAAATSAPKPPAPKAPSRTSSHSPSTASWSSPSSVSSGTGSSRSAGSAETKKAAVKMVKAFSGTFDGIKVVLRTAAKVSVDTAKRMAERAAGVAKRALAPLDRAIEASKNRLARLREQSAELRELASSNAASFASVLGFKAEEGQATTSGDVLASMKERLEKVRAFTANMQKLAKSGLNKQSFAEILSAGVDGGGAIAAALAGDPSAVGGLNSMQSQVNAAAQQLAVMGSNFVYGDRVKKEQANLAKLQGRRRDLGTIKIDLRQNGRTIHTELLKLKRELGGNLGLG